MKISKKRSVYKSPEVEAKLRDSCGMPMKDASEHGNGNIDKPYCIHCTPPDGKLKRRGEVLESMIEFLHVSEENNERSRESR